MDSIYVDTIALFAKHKLDYAMNKVIFELLRSEPFCSECAMNPFVPLGNVFREDSQCPFPLGA